MNRYLIVLLLFFAGCSSNDKTRPDILVKSPADSQRVINSDTLWVNAIFTDNERLGQSRYQITSAYPTASYDTLVPGWFIPASLLRIYNLSGSNSEEMIPLDLDTTYMPGWYTLKISCADFKGNERTDSRKILFLRSEDTLRPQANWNLPVAGSLHSVDDSVFYQFQANDLMSDNSPGAFLEISVYIRDVGGERNSLMEQYFRTGSGQYSFRERLPVGWPAGEYIVLVRMRDRYNNRDSLLTPLSFQ
jgi:hypothetical protein